MNFIHIIRVACHTIWHWTIDDSFYIHLLLNFTVTLMVTNTNERKKENNFSGNCNVIHQNWLTICSYSSRLRLRTTSKMGDFFPCALYFKSKTSTKSIRKMIICIKCRLLMERERSKERKKEEKAEPKIMRDIMKITTKTVQFGTINIIQMTCKHVNAHTDTQRQRMR